MGNFDGVHLGHQSVLALAHAAAAELGAPFGVVTFEPHPRELLRAGRAGLPADDRRRAGAAAAEARGRGALRAAVRRGAGGARPRRRSRARCWPAGSGCGTWWWGRTSASARGGRGTPRRSGRWGRRAGFGVTVAPLVSDGRGRLFLDRDPRGAGGRAAGGGGAHPRALAPDRGRGRARREARAGARVSHREHGLDGPAPAAVRGLCGAGRRAERAARGRYARGRVDRGAADLRRERGEPRGPSLRLRRRSLRRGAVGGAGGLPAAGAEVRRGRSRWWRRCGSTRRRRGPGWRAPTP